MELQSLGSRGDSDCVSSLKQPMLISQTFSACLLVARLVHGISCMGSFRNLDETLGKLSEEITQNKQKREEQETDTESERVETSRSATVPGRF